MMSSQDKERSTTPFENRLSNGCSAAAGVAVEAI